MKSLIEGLLHRRYQSRNGPRAQLAYERSCLPQNIPKGIFRLAHSRWCRESAWQGVPSCSSAFPGGRGAGFDPDSSSVPHWYLE